MASKLLESFRELQAAFAGTARVMATFTDVMFENQAKELSYLVHHPRLPGSMRTARLRKKRRTRVNKWYKELI